MNIGLKTVWAGALLIFPQLLLAQQHTAPPVDTIRKPSVPVIGQTVPVFVAETATHASAPKPAAAKNELTYRLNESGTHFFKATFLNQAWLQYNQSNPGTTVIGVPKDNTFSIGLRRTRLQLFGQISDHVFLYVQFGMNNFNYLNGGFSQNASSQRKIQAFFHDAVSEYLVWKNKDYLKIGGGLTIVNGLSRFSSPSVSSIMSMDVPIFTQATVDQTDEFSRKLSLYARGQVGQLDYRVALSDPFPFQTSGAALPAYGALNPGSDIAATQRPGSLGGTQGNAFPMFGTGSVVYGQVGYLMKRDLFGADTRTLMPCVQA